MAAEGPKELLFQGVEEEDKKFRKEVVGKSQLDIERDMVESKNGVFILFTPSQGTPLMVSEEGVVPEGLIPEARLSSYETSVKPRVETTHAMPLANIDCIYIRYQFKRQHADLPDSTVNDEFYNNFVKLHPNKINDIVILEKTFKDLDNSGMPAAFYYYRPQGSLTPCFFSLFAKQINAHQGNRFTEQGVYSNREQDLAVVNKALETLGLQSIEAMYHAEGVREMSEHVSRPTA